MKLMNPPVQSLIPIIDDPDVRATTAPLIAARTRLATLEDEEQRLIRIATGRADHASNDDIDAAKHTLSIKKGTQSLWFLQPAQEARDQVKALDVSYQAAVASAKRRLSETGLARLKPLCARLADAAHAAQEIAEEIQRLRDELGAAGSDGFEHPVPVLLPGEMLDWQLNLAKEKGLWG